MGSYLRAVYDALKAGEPKSEAIAKASQEFSDKWGTRHKKDFGDILFTPGAGIALYLKIGHRCGRLLRITGHRRNRIQSSVIGHLS